MGFVAPLVTLAAGVYSFMGAQDAAKQTEEAGKRMQVRGNIEADNTLKETGETAFRQRTNNRERLAQLQNEMSSGGADFSGSQVDIFAKASSRLEIEVADTVRAGNIQATARRQAGDMGAFEAKQSANGQRKAAFGSLLSSFGSAAASFAGGSGPKLTSLY